MTWKRHIDKPLRLIQLIWIAPLVMGAAGMLKGCGAGTASAVAANDTAALARVFTPPAIPATIADPQARADYLALHWWDGVEMADNVATGANADSTMIESALPDWLDVLYHTSEDGLGKAVDRIAARKNIYYLLSGLVEKYLYDPNSPMLDEALFDRVLARVEASPALDEADKVRPRFLRGQLAMNRPGTRAADFEYELLSGRRSLMSSISADYLILYFYNPDCHDCRTVRGQLTASPAVASLTAAGRLKILALYPDKDLAAWKGYQSEIPAGWINARDPHGRVKDELYALRAIPTLYLLGRDKTVILKDATFGRIEEQLTKALLQDDEPPM